MKHRNPKVSEGKGYDTAPYFRIIINENFLFLWKIFSVVGVEAVSVKDSLHVPLAKAANEECVKHAGVDVVS